MAYPTVHDIVIIDTAGQWETKSGGILKVLHKIPFSLARRLFDYDLTELADMPDIRGLRSYMVSDIAKDSVGANEWHKIRSEIVFSISGSFLWKCEDMNGNIKEFVVDGTRAVYTPHHVLHTYTALEDGTTVGVLANTLFVADNPTTHDTYSAEAFHQ